MSVNNCWEFSGGPVARTSIHHQAWVQSLIRELDPTSYVVQKWKEWMKQDETKNEKKRVKEKKRQIILVVAVAFSFPHHSEASANTWKHLHITFLVSLGKKGAQ